MIKKFRIKLFTIPEGHYTGPKDLDKTPGALSTVGKSMAIGAGIGGTVGAILPGEDVTLGKGLKKGVKFGFLSGIGLKFLLNRLHNPMSSIKYQEVDKVIRRRFGIYRVSGVTVGDSLEKRAKLEDRFEFNNKDIVNFKINVSIHDDKITLYTFGLSNKELDSTSKHLDYYCKTYFSIEYAAMAINPKLNSYAVSIVFTNYEILAKFLVELSEILETKVNILDSKAVVERQLIKFLPKVLDETEEILGEDRNYSEVKAFNKYELIKLLGSSGNYSMTPLGFSRSPKHLISSLFIGTILNGLSKLGKDELVKEGNLAPRSDFNNTYLEDTLKKLRYVERFNYSVGDSTSEINMSMFSGRFILTAIKGSDAMKGIDDKVWSSMKTKISRVDTGNVVVYSYVINTRNEFEYLLKKLMSLKLNPNIFQG